MVLSVPVLVRNWIWVGSWHSDWVYLIQMSYSTFSYIFWLLLVVYLLSRNSFLFSSLVMCFLVSTPMPPIIIGLAVLCSVILLAHIFRTSTFSRNFSNLFPGIFGWDLRMFFHFKWYVYNVRFGSAVGIQYFTHISIYFASTTVWISSYVGSFLASLSLCRGQS